MGRYPVTYLDMCLNQVLTIAIFSEFLETLKFGIGDGNLQYYLYNWKCPRMEPHKVGLVLQ